jgi:putative protease
MRQGARNFQLHNLNGLVERCHELGLLAYLTVNTIVFDSEMDMMSSILDEAVKAKVDSLICWDPAVVKAAGDRGLNVHLSTQASVANTAAAKFWKEQGVSRVILARELSLEQIAVIKRDSGVEVESFVHGALCIAHSGRCMLSHYHTGRSGSRGECVQPCRREYNVRDVETGHEYRIGNHYVMSPKDLCTLPFIDKLIDCGIDCFKIEGRNRSPEYVKTVTRCYRTAMEAAMDYKLTKDLIDELKTEMLTVYNRGFSDGFYFGLPAGDSWAGNTGSAATHKKVYVGLVKKFYKKVMAAEVLLQNRAITVGEEVIVIGPTTGVINHSIEEIQIDRVSVQNAPKGALIAIKAEELWREGDKLYIMVPVVPLPEQ